MTGLKDTYRSGEENHLGNTGQIWMDVNAVTAPEGNAPVIYATANPAPTWPTIFDKDCEDTLNTLGNCYACNKPGHVKRKPKLRTAKTKDRRESLAVTRRDTWPGIAGDTRGIKDVMLP